MNRYSAHAAFYAPAIPSAAVWRVVIGFLAASAIYLLLNNLLFGAVFSVLGAQSDAFYQDIMAGRTPFAMLLLLGSFGLMITGVAVVTRLIHRRSFLGLIGPMELALSQFGAVLGVMVLLNAAIYILPPWDMGADYVPNMEFSKWVLLLPFSCLLYTSPSPRDS